MRQKEEKMNKRMRPATAYHSQITVLRAKKEKKEKFGNLFAPTQSGIKPSIPKQCQPMARLTNAGQL